MDTSRFNATEGLPSFLPPVGAAEMYASRKYVVTKTAEMQARREGRGFSAGSLLIVNEQGKT